MTCFEGSEKVQRNTVDGHHTNPRIKYLPERDSTRTLHVDMVEERDERSIESEEHEFMRHARSRRALQRAGSAKPAGLCGGAARGRNYGSPARGARHAVRERVMYRLCMYSSHTNGATPRRPLGTSPGSSDGRHRGLMPLCAIGALSFARSKLYPKP